MTFNSQRLFPFHKSIILFLFAFIFVGTTFAQPQTGGRPGGTGGSGGGQPGRPAAKGRVYGKLFDARTNKPLEFVVLRIYKEDSLVVKEKNPLVLGGALSQANGEFTIEDLPVGEKLTLRFSLAEVEAAYFVFTLKPSGGPMGLVEKDLGNLKLTFTGQLNTVTIDGGGPRLEFDKRIYDVDKNPMNSGGTAEDVLRNIPSLQVDTDGNVQLRNAAPQIFVDGRPTTLTIDQIPADAIQRVELITNPSAKYDASGGGGGIVNIVMKHNRSGGYNGSIRAGMDKRGRINSGLDFNIRQGKINFFANANYNQRRSISIGTTDRENVAPAYSLFQNQYSMNDGFMLNGRGGFDWLIDNRNTLTFSGNIMKGSFAPFDTLNVKADTLGGGTGSYYRESNTKRAFQNLGGSVLFKHLFTKEGTELNADINYNRIKSVFDGDYENIYNDANATYLIQHGDVSQFLITSQIDFESKVTDRFRIEAGTRFSVRDFTTEYRNKQLVNGIWEDITSLGVNYHYLDQVYAAYGTAALDLPVWKIKAGLRAESSDYKGELLSANSNFAYKYPIALFPSLFVTRVITEKQDVQFALNRKINRPSFMTLSPFTDYSDSLNIQRGNPGLKPEFTQSGELSWQWIPNKKNTMIVSAYGRYTTNITVRQQSVEPSSIDSSVNIVVTSYQNASSSQALGLEFVSKNSISKSIDISTNINVYNSAIDGTNLDPNLKNNISSFWIKSNITYKAPRNISIQAMFDYSSKRSLEVGSSERGGGGGGGGMGMGGGGWGGSNNTVQGYIEPTYGLDLSVRKEFLENRSLVLSFSAQDVLRTRVNIVHSTSPYFDQTTYKRRDWQMFRFNVSWKFGKMDSQLFKRKNMKMNEGGMEG
jgi:outer membrane receptor protein involved in Fe transport